jgi:phosphate transport system substrate-binding protein
MTEIVVQVVADAALGPVLARLTDLLAGEPGSGTIRLRLGQSSTVALQGLAARVSAFAPMLRDPWPLETRPFRQLHGHEPRSITIGWAGHFSPGVPGPPGIFVNAANSVCRLTMGELRQIFATGTPSGDFTHWGHLVQDGGWVEHRIHPYGPPDNGRTVTSWRYQQLHGLPLTVSYEPLTDDASIVEAVASDRYAIAFMEGVDCATLPASVRRIALSARTGLPYSDGRQAEVRAGLYPLARHFRLYVDTPPGDRLSPTVNAFARVALSDEGQAVLSDEAFIALGLVPLTLADRERERHELELPPARGANCWR